MLPWRTSQGRGRALASVERCCTSSACCGFRSLAALLTAFDCYTRRAHSCCVLGAQQRANLPLQCPNFSVRIVCKCFQSCRSRAYLGSLVKRFHSHSLRSYALVVYIRLICLSCCCSGLGNAGRATRRWSTTMPPSVRVCGGHLSHGPGAALTSQPCRTAAPTATYRRAQKRS